MGLFKRDKEGNRIFKCKHCDMEFDDKERLKRHDRKAHFGKNGGRKRET
jgi:uncharacterized C2H2 Zn-finger protein